LLTATLLTAAPALACSKMEAFDEGMQPILARYLKIQEKLAADSVDGIGEEAQLISRAASRLDTDDLCGEHAAHLKELPTRVRHAAQVLSDARDIAAAREAFKSLSQPVAMWATMSRPPGVSVVFCEMAKASWLQREGEIRNPYYGSEMRTCGQVVSGAGHSPMPMMHEAHDGGCASSHAQY
jgi:Cu(I)/Ag(I) efflux system membrane fusion protein